MSFADQQLQAKIDDLKKRIASWIVSEGERFGAKLTWYSFKSASEHFDEEPHTLPCVLVMCTDETIAEMFSIDGKFYDRFFRLIDKTDFYFEHEGGAVIGFYPRTEELAVPFRDFFEWDWICQLVTPDYSDLYEEIFQRFAKRPEDFQRLEPRKFEQLLDAIFRNNGYKTKLGPRTGDGGVDLHIFGKDAIGDIVTLVQAKRYAKHRPIGLEAVAALSAHVDDRKANRGLFVTTSRFLPSARKFAARQEKRLQLISSPELAEFSKMAATRIIRDKSALVTDSHISSLVSGVAGSGLEGKIVVAHYGYNTDLNEFCIILKETHSAALLMTIPTRPVTHGEPKLNPSHGQWGYEVPICDNKLVSCRTAENVFRAKKTEIGSQVGFWGKRRLYSLWDGKPRFFNICD